MDPLSDVLSLLKPRNYLSAGFDAAGDWAIQFKGSPQSIKSGAVVTGTCWLAVEGVKQPVKLETGDCFLLPRGRPFRLATDLKLPATDAREIFPPVRRGGIATHEGGGEFFLVSCLFDFSGDRAGMLLGLLPPVVHLSREMDQGTLRWSVERMMQELREPQPGSVLVIQHLAQMILVQALRLHLRDAATASAGWLSALADKQIGAAITAMHGNPAHRWTLQELASFAGMSRSSFAERFKQKVGASPIDYLSRWRMLLASDRLANSDDPIGVVASALGYESESAFSAAFRRVMGVSPRQFARNRDATPAIDGMAPLAS
ncbi:MAG: AraC family transcriptional regulator [Hyphomicrobiales bacterium]